MFSPLKRLYYRFSTSLTLSTEWGDVTYDTSRRVANDWFFPRCAGNEFHEPVVTEHVLRSIPADGVFYDVGAHVGYFTVLAETVAREVHAFELDSRYVAAILAHPSPSDAERHVSETAVAGESGRTVPFEPHSRGDGSTNQLRTAGEPRDGAETVSTTTLDDYVETSSPPDVLKIDVEGLELSVLRGAEELLRTNPPETMFVEIHPEQMDPRESDVTAILDYLSEHGYSCEKFVDHRNSRTDLQAVEGEIETNAMLKCERTSDVN